MTRNTKNGYVGGFLVTGGKTVTGGKIAPDFASPGLCFAKPLSGLAKRRKQPERYTTWGLNW
ncbi:MAG: hypothetical protein LBI57_06580 [Helicobacteraceae bacterium]|jgi:hypothetical protein|nr:hypothetical protein [Helicobacteraceae bacterium]